MHADRRFGWVFAVVRREHTHRKAQVKEDGNTIMCGQVDSALWAVNLFESA
jgi:hypothetical protein